MPAVTGQRIAALTLKTIERVGNEADFNLLFQTLQKKASDLDLEDAKLPRKRKTPSFQLFANAEKFPVKAAMKQSYIEEINKVRNQFKGDIDASAIPAEISVYQTIFEDVQVINFQEIVKHLQTIAHVERSLMTNILI